MNATALLFPLPLSTTTPPVAEPNRDLREKLDLILATLSELRRDIRFSANSNLWKDSPQCIGIEDDVIENEPRAELPLNVVPVGRNFFRTSDLPPAEAVLDPVLERATIEELNAALEAAFSQIAST